MCELHLKKDNCNVGPMLASYRMLRVMQERNYAPKVIKDVNTNVLLTSLLLGII